jgi:hypothetical protein
MQYFICRSGLLSSESSFRHFVSDISEARARLHRATDALKFLTPMYRHPRTFRPRLASVGSKYQHCYALKTPAQIRVGAMRFF